MRWSCSLSLTCRRMKCTTPDRLFTAARACAEKLGLTVGSGVKVKISDLAFSVCRLEDAEPELLPEPDEGRRAEGKYGGEQINNEVVVKYRVAEPA